jgi:dephospho-CoA kinase
MSNIIIGVLGRKGSGKDTISDHIIKKYNYEKMQFAEPLKSICKTLFNFSDEQVYGDLKETIDPAWGVTPRHVLQYIGTNMFRNHIKELFPEIGNNFWVNLIKIKYLKKCESSNNVKVIVSDVRFQNEIDIIHQLNGKVIKLTRPSLTNNDEHESEKNIDNLNGDFTIINDGSLEELYSKVNKIINTIN